MWCVLRRYEKLLEILWKSWKEIFLEKLEGNPVENFLVIVSAFADWSSRAHPSLIDLFINAVHRVYKRWSKIKQSDFCAISPKGVKILAL